jgi:hypothetical protein
VRVCCVRRGRVDGKDVGARAVSSSARSARRRQLVIPREAEKSVDVEERREGEEEQGIIPQGGELVEGEKRAKMVKKVML